MGLLGEAYVVTVYVESKPLTLLVHSGSSTTLLARHHVPDNIPITKPKLAIQLRGVTGHLLGNIVGSAIFPFDFVNRAGCVSVEFETIIYEVAELKIPDGLLGVNFLAQFSINLNFSRQSLRIEGREFALQRATEGINTSTASGS